jgi:hypothetical protein
MKKKEFMMTLQNKHKMQAQLKKKPPNLFYNGKKGVSDGKAVVVTGHELRARMWAEYRCKMH